MNNNSQNAFIYNILYSNCVTFAMFFHTLNKIVINIFKAAQNNRKFIRLIGKKTIQIFAIIYFDYIVIDV